MFDINTTVGALIIVLLMGTIYAWYQFILVLARRCDTCSLDLKENPFKSKCLWAHFLCRPCVVHKRRALLGLFSRDIYISSFPHTCFDMVVLSALIIHGDV